MVTFFTPYLDRGLREVVWVAKLGCDIELEVMRVFNGGVSQFDAEASTLLKCLLQQQGLKDGVKLLCNVLQQHLQTNSDQHYQQQL